jgi:hypothetical protein
MAAAGGRSRCELCPSGLPALTAIHRWESTGRGRGARSWPVSGNREGNGPGGRLDRRLRWESEFAQKGRPPGLPFNRASTAESPEDSIGHLHPNSLVARADRMVDDEERWHTIVRSD